MYKERTDGVSPAYIEHGIAHAVGTFHPLDSGATHPDTAIGGLIPAIIARHEIVSDSVSDRGAWNPFSHYRRDSDVKVKGPWYDMSEPSYWVDYPTSSGSWRWAFNFPSPLPCFAFSAFGSPENPFNRQPELYEITGNGLYIPPPVDLPDLMQRAFESALPKLRSKTSLVNSLLELKDMKSLPHSCSKIRDTMHWLNGQVSSLTGKVFSKQHGASSLRELSRRAADIHLQYAFNIKPLLQDINGVMNSIKSYQRQANRLITDSEKVHKHHFQVMIGSDVTDTTETTDWYPVEFSVGNGIRNMWCRTGRFIQLLPSKFHSEIQFSFYWSDFSRRHAALLSLADDLGLNFNPAIIWNAIPWSFVVDWFVGIGPWLSRFRQNMMEPIVCIERALWSITRTREGSTFVDAGLIRGIPCSHVRETAYRRALWNYDSSSIMASGLSSSEFALGVSLAVSRRRHHHNRK